MIFKSSDGKEFTISETVRNQIKPNWMEMLKPSKERKLEPQLHGHKKHIDRIIQDLGEYGITLVGKDILEAGCGYGEKCFEMAQYEGTKVHGIDVDEYTVEQSPDLNSWNPEDVALVHNKLDEVHNELANKFPKCVSDKVTFETIGIEGYATPNLHDLIVSWDVLEHIIDLPLAFHQMSNALKKGGVAYHEYNPFFSINGGHSLCTLDFLYGHCILSSKDFERYVREIRPEEEKVDLNFYYKCLNRATRADIKELSEKNGFEILKFKGNTPMGEEFELWKKDVNERVLPIVKEYYPNIILDDFISDSVLLILRKI